MNCPIHNVPFKTVPAGVSKSTGRPYNAFEACPERGCKEKPPKVYVAPQSHSAGGSGGAGNLGADKLMALERIAIALEKIADKDLKNIPF